MVLSEKIEIPSDINMSDFVKIKRNKLPKKLDELSGSKRWRRSIETNKVHGYRIDAGADNRIIGLIIFQVNASKEECVKCFALKDAS